MPSQIPETLRTSRPSTLSAWWAATGYPERLNPPSSNSASYRADTDKSARPLRLSARVRSAVKAGVQREDLPICRVACHAAEAWQNGSAARLQRQRPAARNCTALSPTHQIAEQCRIHVFTGRKLRQWCVSWPYHAYALMWSRAGDREPVAARVMLTPTARILVIDRATATGYARGLHDRFLNNRSACDADTAGAMAAMLAGGRYPSRDRAQQDHIHESRPKLRSTVFFVAD